MPPSSPCRTVTTWHVRSTPVLLFLNPQRYHFDRLAATACAATAAPTAGTSDEHFMGLALQQAQLAAEAGEVPIGAVLVINSEVAAAAYNQTETRCNPLSHAELLCISAAAEQQLAWRLQEATLYSTIEPCPMCAGAILQARLARLVYGARQPRVGADGSWVAMFPRQPQPQQSHHHQRQQENPDQQQQHQQHAGTAECEEQGSSQQQQTQRAAAVSNPGDAQQPLQQQQQGHEQQQQQPLQPVGPHPFHPNIQVTAGVRADECAALMKHFFQQRRKQQKAATAAAGAADAAVASAGQCSCQGDVLQQGQPAAPGAEGARSAAGRASELDAAVWLSSSPSESSSDEGDP